MDRVLVTEKLAQPGLDLMAESGYEVDVQLGLSPEDLVAAVVGAQALVIRSATTVTAEVLAAGTDLVVVGRAGIGLDNVDVAAATERGVMVVNAPQSNILSAAEQAMALLLAQARNIPQAHAALVAGKWERSKWEGVELYGKTLGIVGLGRVGALVAQRALAFGMRLVAYDPFVSHDRAKHMGVELMDLDDLMAQSDFVTVHLPKNAETLGLIGKDLLAKSKPGLRIINTARGGIVDEEALADAIRSGQVQGAGLDVFAKEPTTESPLFELASVVVAPHLGASTVEAQDKAGVTIASRSSSPSTATSSPSRSTWPPPTCPRPSAPSWGWPSSWAGSCRASTPGCPTPLRSSTRAAWPAPARASSPCRCSRGCSRQGRRSQCPTSTPRSWPPNGGSRCGRPRRSPPMTSST